MSWLGYLCVEKLEVIQCECSNGCNKDIYVFMKNQIGLVCILVMDLKKDFLYFVSYSTSSWTPFLFINQTFNSSLNVMEINRQEFVMSFCYFSLNLKKNLGIVLRFIFRCCTIFLGSKIIDELWRAIMGPTQLSFVFLNNFP